MFAFPLLSQALLAAALTYHVGQQPLSFQAPQLTAQLGVRSSEVHGLVWYPVDAGVAETPQFIGDPANPIFEAGSAAPGASIAASPKTFALVLVSHGTGGAARQMAWLGTALARAGFIAVAIDHPGNTAAGEQTVQGNTLPWLRARELSLALDAVLANPAIGPRVDRTRIGAAGFSLGGYTVIALGGARRDAAAYLAYCARHPDALGNCHAPPEFPQLVSQMNALIASDAAYAKALSDGGGSVADPRVRAIFAIAPAVAESVSLESLASVSVPVRIAYGTNDVTVDPRDNALRYAGAIPNATLLTISGAGHYTFLDTCTGAGKAIVPSAVCIDAAGVDRDAAHAEAASDAIAFFERTLGR
jgi:predicted dienelactone hydrolase